MDFMKRVTQRGEHEAYQYLRVSDERSTDLREGDPYGMKRIWVYRIYRAPPAHQVHKSKSPDHGSKARYGSKDENLRDFKLVST